MIGNRSIPQFLSSLPKEECLTVMFIALLRQCNGEVHISAESFENIDSGVRLTTDWDAKTQQLVLRAGSPSMMIFEVKAPKWQTQQPPIQPHLVAPTNNSNHRVIDEAQMFEIFEKWKRKEMMREWRDQGTAVVANMPSPMAPRDG